MPFQTIVVVPLHRPIRGVYAVGRASRRSGHLDVSLGEDRAGGQLAPPRGRPHIRVVRNQNGRQEDHYVETDSPPRRSPSSLLHIGDDYERKSAERTKDG